MVMKITTLITGLVGILFLADPAMANIGGPSLNGMGSSNSAERSCLDWMKTKNLQQSAAAYETEYSKCLDRPEAYK
jgi:hypothetical protein